ncbi:hypothetical protein CVT25_009659 [Psilocybe cyanescens]|uniref:MARVEL domain-containing protein n=1 Tax=Psilocybe cyanescens TaxID=93625 RepID=A0A409XH00_PSICY|nr:hypothetical protein CVT25_009659 [Psilocybe cyanescens]
MADSAPLIGNPDIIEHGEISVTTRPSRPPKLFKILRILTLVLSTLTLILIITNYIILGVAPFWNSYWQSRVNGKVIGWIIASFIASLINAFINISVLINIVSDTTFAVGTIVSMVRWIDNMPFDNCNNQYHWRDRTPIPPHPKCKDWKLALNIIMGFTAAFGILLATSYVCLLLLRVYEVLKTKFWTKSSWSIPTGEITWTINLNVITDGHERTYGLSAGAKSGSKAAHGPVHL